MDNDVGIVELSECFYVTSLNKYARKWIVLSLLMVLDRRFSVLLQTVESMGLSRMTSWED